MTPETEDILKRNIQELTNDICFLERKKLIQPENSYKIDRSIFLHLKIKRSIEIELETVKIQSIIIIS